MELCGAFKCGTAVLFYVVYFLRSVIFVSGVDQYPTYRDNPTRENVSNSEDFLFFYQGVEGTPGVDFPVYSHIPRTTFSCKGLESGYYADIDTDCQVFHICEDEKKISFLCPNGTIFQQTDLICEWWFKVNCSQSPYLYEESAENLRENTARRKLNRRVHLHVQDKTSNQLKENSFVDETNNNRFLNNKIPKHNINNNFNNIVKNISEFGNNRKNINDNHKRNSNKISSNIKQQPQAHQKTRRFNENDLGNFENNDYDKFTFIPTSTSATITRKYLNNLRNTQKGYHVEFPSSATATEETKEPDYPKHRNLNLAQNSDESQVPQETAAFVRNSLNSIDETSSYNPFPNHRTTYSDLRTVPYTQTKLHSTISSVTPQYITTQPINNGKPFLGNRVGGKVKSTKDPLFINPQIITNNTKIDKSLDTDDVFRVHVITTAEKNASNSMLVTPKVLEKILFAKIKPIDETTDVTTSLFSTTTEPTVVTTDTTQSTTIKTYPTKKLHKTTSQPFLIHLDEAIIPTKSTTTKSRTQDYAVVYGSYTATTPRSLPSNAVEVKFNKTATRVGVQLGKSFGSPPPKPISVVKPIDKIRFEKIQVGTVKPKTDDDKEILVSQTSSSILESLRNKGNVKSSNFYVTKSKESFSTTPNPNEISNDNRIYNITIRSTTQLPRPFQRVAFVSSTSSSTAASLNSKTFDYKISTASPFKSLSTPQPTLPTPFFSTTTSIDEHVDNMLDVLTAISKERDMSNGNSRPGLVVPPSVGPQTLHTLSVYFANALDEVIAQKAKTSSKRQEKLMMENKEKLTTLLTQMTVHGYNQLFNKKQTNNNTEEVVTVKNDSKNVIEKEDFKIESPQIRQLAKNFTLALSAYLNDPEMFKKDLENFRPTEPPFDAETTTEFNVVDEELLNYSDADAKTSFPPIFTTSQSPVPTWGFILADVDNVIHSDLNTADTQSFLPGLNDINRGKTKPTSFQDLPQDHWTTSTSATDLWKSTFVVDPSLLNDEFDSTPELFDVSTEQEQTTPENLPAISQSREINYELRTLPKVAVNSSEVSGILIDFMSNSSNGDNKKFHRLLRKLNTTEDEFLIKMKEIESNPVTRRLILLLISECGKNTTDAIKKENYDSLESLEVSETSPLLPSQVNDEATRSRHNSLSTFLGPSLKEDDQDTRALQLLNTLYHIASKLGK